MFLINKKNNNEMKTKRKQQMTVGSTDFYLRAHPADTEKNHGGCVKQKKSAGARASQRNCELSS